MLTHLILHPPLSPAASLVARRVPSATLSALPTRRFISSSITPAATKPTHEDSKHSFQPHPSGPFCLGIPFVALGANASSLSTDIDATVNKGVFSQGPPANSRPWSDWVLHHPVYNKE